MPNQYTKKKIEERAQRKEIYWNLINSALAGGISFFSALIATKALTWEVIFVSLSAATIVFLVKFQKFWDGEKKEYLFKFI